MTNPNIVTAPLGIEPHYISALAQAALKDRVFRGLRPHEAPVCLADVVSDGRKAKRIARELIDAGLLRETPSATVDGEVGYQVQIEPVLALLTAAKPNLTTLINDWHRSAIVEERQPIGVEFDRLALGERLWVVTYPHEYQFVWVGHHKEIAFKLGDALPDKHWNMSLLVSDAALRSEFDAAIRARKIDALMKHNARWALEKMLKLDEETVKTFTSISTTGVFRHHDDDVFSGDHTTWAETAQRLVTQAQAQLASAMKRVEAAAKVTQAVAQHGGWDKLGTDLRVKIEAKIDEQES